MTKLKSLLSNKIPLNEDDMYDLMYGADRKIPDQRPKDTYSKSAIGTSSSGGEDTSKSKEFPLGALEEANTVKVSKADRENEEFMLGLKQAVIDKGNETNRNLSDYSSDWQRGYKVVKRSSWWDKINSKLTGIATNLGRSYGTR